MQRQVRTGALIPSGLEPGFIGYSWGPRDKVWSTQKVRGQIKECPSYSQDPSVDQLEKNSPARMGPHLGSVGVIRKSTLENA